MITKEERCEIKARFIAAQNGELYAGGYSFSLHYQQDVPKLLDALEETEKQICYKCHDANVNDEDGMSDILADRDRWKAQAEALERAITDKELNKDYRYMGYGQQEFACQLCIHKEASCVCSDLENWAFDKARFTGGMQQ